MENKGFLKIDKGLISSDMGIYSKLLLAYYIDLAFYKHSATIQYSDKCMSKLLNCSDKTINRARKELEEKGYITTYQQKNQGRNEAIKIALKTNKLADDFGEYIVKRTNNKYKQTNSKPYPSKLTEEQNRAISMAIARKNNARNKE